MDLDNYFDFAEDDFIFFKNAFSQGLRANVLGAIAQNICEKYMKHIIQINSSPKSFEEESKLQDILRTHSLGKLMNYMNNMNIEFSYETRKLMRTIDGYYFSARYPSQNSYRLGNEELEECYNAVIKCREEVIDIIKNLETTKKDELEM